MRCPPALVAIPLVCCAVLGANAADPQLKPGLWKFTALSLDSAEQDRLICLAPEAAARIGIEGWATLESAHAQGCTITRQATADGYRFNYQCPRSDPRGNGSFRLEAVSATSLHTTQNQTVTLSLNSGATQVPMESETTGQAEWVGSDCGAEKQ